MFPQPPSKTSVGSHRPPVVEFSEIEFIEKIGEGQYGAVWKANCRGQVVAVKKFDSSTQRLNPLEELEREMRAYSSLASHPNVVRFVGICLDPGNFCIMMEYLPKQSLESIIYDKSLDLPMPKRLKILIGIASGMQWLHSLRPTIVHRDLKPANVLMDSFGNPKVCDFGFSKFKAANSTIHEGKVIQGSPAWMAPERFRGQMHDETVDVYSFAVIIWQVMTRETPVAEFRSLSQLIQAVCQDNWRPSIPRNLSAFSPELKSLIERCWDSNPKNRPTFEEIGSELEKILLKFSFPFDPDAILFWRHTFPRTYCVEWIDLIEKFYGFLGRPLPADLELDATHLSFRHIIKGLCFENPSDQMHSMGSMRSSSSSSQPFVSIENFGRFISWFGPLSNFQRTHSASLQKPLDHGVEEERSGSLRISSIMTDSLDSSPLSFPSRNPEPDILSYLRSISREPWFFGLIKSEEAQALLVGKPPGTFMVRLSQQTHPGLFSITRVNAQSVVKQCRFLYRPDQGFLIDKSQLSESSVEQPQLVQPSETHSLLEFMRAIMRPMMLHNPCLEGHPFKHFFALESSQLNESGYDPDGDITNDKLWH